MRPIDADALMEKLNGIWDCNDITFAPVDRCYIDADCKSCRWRETIEYVKRLVQNQTTISPWHRVEEPPKEPGKQYVVWARKGYAYCDKWFGDRWLISSVAPETVTHWMPIEPPKEDA